MHSIPLSKILALDECRSKEEYDEYIRELGEFSIDGDDDDDESGGSFVDDADKSAKEEETLVRPSSSSRTEKEEEVKNKKKMCQQTGRRERPASRAQFITKSQTQRGISYRFKIWSKL